MKKIKKLDKEKVSKITVDDLADKINLIIDWIDSQKHGSRTSNNLDDE